MISSKSFTSVLCDLPPETCFPIKKNLNQNTSVHLKAFAFVQLYFRMLLNQLNLLHAS